MDYYLDVQITVVGTYFRAAVAFKRFASYELPNGESGQGYMTSWERTATGTVIGDNAEYVIDSLNHVLEIFLNEYLKANQD